MRSHVLVVSAAARAVASAAAAPATPRPMAVRRCQAVLDMRGSPSRRLVRTIGMRAREGKCVMAGSQDIVEDSRNATVKVWVNGRLVPRDAAVVSVFDGGFIAGDGVWEGLRLIDDRLLFLDEHLDRLFAGARAIDLDVGMSRGELVAALEATCRAYGMHDGVCIRRMVTRGMKRTPSQDPRQTIGAATVVIVAEYKVPAVGCEL